MTSKNQWKFRRKPIFTILAVALALFISLWNESSKREHRMNTLKDHATIHYDVVSKFYSLDPLDADISANLAAARMVYTTPLEVTVDNRLTSQVASEFSYDPSTATIRFVIKTDLKFSDGTDLTVEDVAFSISRMAYSRPRFPVLADIKGLHEWLSTKSPLESFPNGITINGQELRIKLDRNIHNPLYRFCLEVFSIVPRSLVDRGTNKLKIHRPPSSGLYVIDSETEHETTFRLWKSPIDSHRIQTPLKITLRQGPFDFSNVNDFPHKTVLAGFEDVNRMGNIDLERLGFKVTWTPASSYFAAILNPMVPPFNDPNCRALFAKEFRKAFSQELSSSAGVEPSFFPRVVSGYLDSSQLDGSRPKGIESCSDRLRSVPLKWVQFRGNKRYSYFERILEKMQSQSTLRLSAPGTVSTMEENKSAFLSGMTALYFFGSGFWPLDPVGDVQMLFTPYLHKHLAPVWSDPEVLSRIDRIRLNSDEKNVKNLMEDLNRYMYRESIFVPFMHFRRYFASKSDGTLRDLPLAVQQPYPWQVFNLQPE